MQTITHLYIKTHLETELKYFGKTKSSDPFKYLGSGKYWIKHLKVHGNNIHTEILGSFTDLKECYEVALKFSLDNDIVNSDKWANLKLELLDGGWDHINNNPYYNSLRSIKTTGENNGMYGKKHSEESKLNISKNKIGKKLGKQTDKHIEKKRLSKCSKYLVTDPNGIEYMVDDLPTFCINQKIPYKTISKIPKKGFQPTRGAAIGWNCRLIN